MSDYDEASLDKDTVVARAITSSATVALRGVAIRAIGLITNLVLARLLAPADFGLAALGFTTLTFAMFLADGGLGAGLIRRAEPPTRVELQSILGFQILATTTVLLVILVFAPHFGESGWLVLVMTAPLLAIAFEAPGAILLERRLDFGKRVAVEVAEAGTYSVVAIVAVALGAGVWGIAIGVVARGLAGATVMNLVTPFRVLRPRFKVSAIRGVLAFGVKYQSVGAVNLIRDQSINLGLAAIGGVGALGFWSLGNRIVQIPYVVFESLGRVSFPAMSRLHASGVDTAGALRRIMNVVALMGGLASVCLAASSPHLLGVVFGDRWQPTSVVIFPSCIGLIVNGPISVGAAGFLYSRGYSTAILWSTIAHTVAWVGVALGLYHALGLLSVGLAALAGGLVDASILGTTLWRASGVNPARVIAVPVAIGILAAWAGNATCAALPADFLSLVVGAAVAGGLFLGGVTLCHRRALTDLSDVLHRVYRSGRKPAVPQA